MAPRSFLTFTFLFAVLFSQVSASTKPQTKRRGLQKVSKVSKALKERDYAPVDASGYAPVLGDCPANFRVREVPLSGYLHHRERDYLQQHAEATLPAWRNYLENVQLEDFNIDDFLSTGNLPVTGIAASGGGFRAMLFEGGILNGLDNRNASAVDAKTGGALEVMTYLAGLSGGSWLVSSWALADAPTFQELNAAVWQLEEPFYVPKPPRANPEEDALTNTALKKAAGYPVSIVDLYGRLLSYSLVAAPDTPGTEPGVGTLWSAIRETQSFQNGSLPFPIITVIGKPDTQPLQLSDPTYEINVYEFGIRHPTLNAFIDLKYLGTNLVDGTVPSGELCTQGFENAGFLFGTSSDIFLEDPAGAETLLPLFGADSLAELFPGGTTTEDVSGRYPSPFQGLNPGVYQSSAQSELELADGGSTGEVIPFLPLTLPERNLDVILALDGSNDMNGRPNGSSPYNTYLRSRLPGGYDFVDFPEVPKPGDPAYSKITWFGCDDKYTIIYVPNIAMANNETGTSTFELAYTDQQVQAFFDNSFSIITQPETNGEWPICLACALVDKQLMRNGQGRTSQCQQCFNQYCYGGDNGGGGNGGGNGPSPPSPGPSQWHHHHKPSPSPNWHHHHHHKPSPSPKWHHGPSPSPQWKRNAKMPEQFVVAQPSTPHTSEQPVCPKGATPCPVSSGGYECVDLSSELGSCGKCWNNCEEMPGVSKVGSMCQEGKCRATSCQTGWRLDRSDCVRM